jgi:hypothetical protein
LLTDTFPQRGWNLDTTAAVRKITLIGGEPYDIPDDQRFTYEGLNLHEIAELMKEVLVLQQGPGCDRVVL